MYRSLCGLIKSPRELLPRCAFSSAAKRLKTKRAPVKNFLRAQRAFLGLGSNVGDRVGNLEDALAALTMAGLPVLRTSPLYETTPMYVEAQDRFLNAVCEVQTPTGSTPLDLLDAVKAIETQLGREKSVDKGPRAIDLDILTFGNETVNHDRLIVPHHSILEREFVLRPLSDIEPFLTLRDTRYSVANYLEKLPKRELHTSLVPLRNQGPFLRPGLRRKTTHIMGILNMTPDSFSDGGKNSLDPTSVQMQEQLSAWLQAGATFLDIGGQSTAPNAFQVTAEEELSRVMPIIEHIRSDSRFDHILLSVDTFRASIAEAAVLAGVDVVNDVSAGLMDSDMLTTVARLRVPIILMHMRGDPSTMQTMTDYPNGLLHELHGELEGRLRAAMEAGIPRWRIILDPGIGFAKQRGQNVEVLRSLANLTSYGIGPGPPWLIGTSRKAFIGHITGVKTASERDLGTAAAVSAAIAGGADIVRVHNPALVQTVQVADAIWRDSYS